MLPEADRYDMEEFLGKVSQLLPILGSEVLNPIGGIEPDGDDLQLLTTEIKGLVARGRRTPSGFVVLGGSQAVGHPRPSAEQWMPALLALRQQLLADKALVEEDGHLVFSRDVEFSSPSAAASIIHGGNMNGFIAWRNASGATLGDIEKDELLNPAIKR